MVDVAVAVARIDAVIGRADAFAWLPQLRAHGDAPLPYKHPLVMGLSADPLPGQLSHHSHGMATDVIAAAAHMATTDTPGVWHHLAWLRHNGRVERSAAAGEVSP